MNHLITFFVEFLLLSIIFYLGYLIIKNHTTPTFRRFYLLAWMVFSFSFPLISVQTPKMPEMNIGKLVQKSANRPVPGIEQKEPLELQSSEVEMPEINEPIVSKSDKNMDWFTVVKLGYMVVVTFFILRIIMGVFQIIKLKSKAQKIHEYEGSVFQVNEPSFKGASFFNWVFIGKNIDKERNVIIQHEKTHIKLFHSLDILLSHIYCALFWVNPFCWLLKRFVALNTELEVDHYIVKSESKETYANVLLSLAGNVGESSIMNHFSALHLKTRIVALTMNVAHKKWVSLFSLIVVLGLFFIVSCENANSSEMMVQRLNEVKTITTRFISHQSDTQQKTGKIVAVASFAPDGSLEELVEQTTYPYDRSYEVKKVFWEQPEKMGIPFVMDGLSLGGAEKSFLYGHDWPNAYFKHLRARSESRDLPWDEIVETDNETLPSEIMRRKENQYENLGNLVFPDITEYFEYDAQKVVKTFSMSVYPQGANNDKKPIITFEDSSGERQGKLYKKLRMNSGKKVLTSEYSYNGNLLSLIKWKDTERRFYYENGLMVKSEYLKSGEVINTRMHFYKSGLKDRTEIYNRHNEPEYTITYEYEFW